MVFFRELRLSLLKNTQHQHIAAHGLPAFRLAQVIAETLFGIKLNGVFFVNYMTV
jgi:hypothetical protein